MVIGEQTQAWIEFIFLVVSMGDRPAAMILEVVIRMTVQIFRKIDLYAAHKLERPLCRQNSDRGYRRGGQQFC